MSEFVDVFNVDHDTGEMGDAEPAVDDAAEPDLFYPDPLAFFRGTLGPSYVREVNGGSEFVWCPQWYKHPEALARIEAVWRAWEHLRMDGALGSSIWWINHADPHMSVLMTPNGPFKKCIYEGHIERAKPEQVSLPHIEPEESIYPDS
ncbi:DUF4913 domain-containing protein [Arthrobacter sp. CAL618]|uniref:DUF4913 domain-containing protein n=1 Tax=Arthrobacter sp. CAL618 TaxID=1055770 RepID=UPI0003F7E8F7|nr:DUF4913 domain-containing protein [Arthrobacter sp. CAL618]